MTTVIDNDAQNSLDWAQAAIAAHKANSGISGDDTIQDRLERRACQAVCRDHAGEAQGWFLGDWRAAYIREFGR